MHSEQNYQTSGASTSYQIFDFLPDSVVLSKNGIIEFVNQEGIRLFGARNLHELIGRRIVDLAHPDYKIAVSERMKRSVSYRESMPLMEQRIINL